MINKEVNDKHEMEESIDFEKMEERSEPILPEINVFNLTSEYNRLTAKYSTRDARMAQVKSVRDGNISDIAPDIFPDNGPWQEPIVANMIDIAARDMSEMISPLPSFNCSSPTMTSDRARERASVRTKIAQAYVDHSDLQVQMHTAADWYVTYGFAALKVEIDYENRMPILRALDPVGCYPRLDRYNRVVSFYQKLLVDADELCDQFPEISHLIKGREQGVGNTITTGDIEVVFYHNKDWDVAFIPGSNPILLDKMPNPIGAPMVVMATRPGATTDPRGQFDDVIFVQLAKTRLALLSLQAAHESVNAPLILPTDVPNIPMGPGATIRTNNPAGVRRVGLEIPQAAFQEQAQLDRELQLGSRFPEMRTGNSDASVVTGKGVQALMGGYESQVVTHQSIWARALSKAVSIMFEVDEKVFGNMKKTLRSSSHGTPFEVTYSPMKDIAGDYTVDVRYGLMAGLDPNRWLVFALQARAEKMFSRDFMRREMPVSINVEDEARKIDMEELDESLKQALAGYASSIPALASQGQDPTKVINAVLKARTLITAGKPLHLAISEAFAPEEPKPVEPTVDQAAMLAEQGMMTPETLPGEAMPPEAAQQAPAGPEGAPAAAPTGPPDIATLLAGLSASGKPNLSANISRRTQI